MLIINLLPTVDSHSLIEFLDIFRPFVGYKEVRLVSKESRHVSGLGIGKYLICLLWHDILLFSYTLNCHKHNCLVEC